MNTPPLTQRSPIPPPSRSAHPFCVVLGARVGVRVRARVRVRVRARVRVTVRVRARVRSALAPFAP